MLKCSTFPIITIALLMVLLSDSQASPLPDFDGNGTVDFPDFLLFVGKFGSQRGGERYEDQFDLDGDGAIAFPDFLIFISKFGKRAPLTVDMLDFPLRSIHASGNWGDNARVVEVWEAEGKAGPDYIEWLRNLVHGDDAVNGKIPLVPSEYIDWLNSLHVNWIGISVGLHYTDSMDGRVKRVYAEDVDTSTYTADLTYSDDALKQMIREFRAHGFDVYLTLAFEAHDESSQRPVERWLIGHPYGHELSPRILPENWPWRPDHPDHERFVAEFWETYTQQAVHFARIAEEEGVGLYSLGTETESLFRTRPGDINNPEQEHWVNDFGRELRAMVDRVRAVYTGLLTYDMHYSALKDPEYFGPGSNHLWEDLDLDIVGISAYFPLSDTAPTTVMSVESLEASYEQIFQDYLIPLAARNPNRPVVFTEYGATDRFGIQVVAPDAWENDPFVFADSNGNGIDDGRETQANIYQALINTMDKHPGVVNGVFWEENWMGSDALWAQYWADRRTFSIRGKPAEKVVRAAYEEYKERR